MGQALHQVAWYITIDLRDAFISQCSYAQGLLQVSLIFLEGEDLKFRRLPPGLTSSPQAFTNITRPPVEHFRVRGIRVIFHLDDILVLANSRQLVCQHRYYVFKLPWDAGYKHNAKKGRLIIRLLITVIERTPCWHSIGLATCPTDSVLFTWDQPGLSDQRHVSYQYSTGPFTLPEKGAKSEILLLSTFLVRVVILKPGSKRVIQDFVGKIKTEAPPKS